jgi:hypothetical protein
MYAKEAVGSGGSLFSSFGAEGESAADVQDVDADDELALGNAHVGIQLRRGPRSSLRRHDCGGAVYRLKAPIGDFLAAELLLRGDICCNQRSGDDVVPLSLF